MKKNKPEIDLLSARAPKSIRTRVASGKARKKPPVSNQLIIFLMVIVLVVLSVSIAFNAGFFGSAESSNSTSDETSIDLSITPTIEPSFTLVPDLSAKAVISAVGDIILHESIMDGGRISQDTYNFDYLFASVLDIFKKTDYIVANFEGTLDGPPYQAWPLFNYPDEIASTIQQVGIQMVTTANNHAYDRGLSGVNRTVELFKQAGVQVIGTRSDPEETKYKIVDINGIQFGFTGYTYETTGTPETRTLNGLAMPQSAHELIDSFNPYRADRFASDKQEMMRRIALMREDGVECVVFVIHWGNEYQTKSNKYQRELAQFLADEGVDIIFGHHPHVIQEMEVITSAKRNKNTLVYYSLGNFLANMLYSTHGTKGYSEDALIAMAEVSRDQTGEIFVTKGEYITSYIYKEKVGIKIRHRAVPVEQALTDPTGYHVELITNLLTECRDRIATVVSSQTGDHNGTIVGAYPND